MKPSEITEDEAIKALRYHLKLRRDRQRRLANSFLKIEKLQPRQHIIRSLMEQISNALTIQRAMKGLDYQISQDALMYKHLTGKVADKTAGRNQLSLRDGK
jgi:hypothetical protein